MSVILVFLKYILICLLKNVKMEEVLSEILEKHTKDTYDNFFFIYVDDVTPRIELTFKGYKFIINKDIIRTIQGFNYCIIFRMFDSRVEEYLLNYSPYCVIILDKIGPQGCIFDNYNVTYKKESNITIIYDINVFSDI